MVTQYIEVGNQKWDILCYYDVSEEDFAELADVLHYYGCPNRDIVKSLNIITSLLNTGMTFTNTEWKTSIVCISKASSGELFVNTLVHEAKHAQSHICEHYNITEDGEQAAYLIGYIVQRMYRGLRRYGRF